ncbi:Serine/threonine-protein kinase [Rhynchospora pubera]|uniref:Receptor-like serine/threonine-protein kinase n=1 Tax=Rhynchospora pubera TaxID=906938 RepID=A0AAV8GBD8_9POAL|nr:Serine/threonine-protein kinase [Rhynchospora pubera]
MDHRIDFFIAILLLSFTNVDGKGNALNASEALQDDQLLTSTNGIFQLGFFNTTSSNIRYLGIWYNLPSKMIVWVANRDHPIISGSGTFYLSPAGTLFIQNSTGQDIWSTGSQFSQGEPQACLLDSGHLVVNDTETGKILWQSSYQLSDSLLANTPLGYVKLLDSTLEYQLSSWNSTGIDPSPGQYVRKFDPARKNELVTFKGSYVFYRTGPWNGTGWNGFPKMNKPELLRFHVSASDDGGYFWYEPINPLQLWIQVLNSSDGRTYRYYWNASNNNWALFWTAPDQSTPPYATCGPYGIYYDSTCHCCTGDFHYKKEDLDKQQFSGGCIRDRSLNGTYHKFVTVTNLKLPDTINAVANGTLSKSECESWCQKNSSCTAFAYIGWQGCLAWFGDIIDMQKFNPDDGYGDSLYIRVASKKGSHNWKIIFIIVGVGIAAVLILLAALILIRKLLIRWLFNKPLQTGENNPSDGEEDIQIFESFDFNTIRKATGDFSKANIIGEGQLGQVYEGVLDSGEEIAVKRLSKHASKGKEQLKNELYLLAKLKHRNLVKLKGFCVQQQEIMLCYEFMQNNSLDRMLFRLPEGASELNWEQRYKILQGISSGLLYLHEDNGDIVIHRDVKPGNILLDRKMVPKISDFGLARLYEEERSFFPNTSIVGTLGYMAPELQNGMLSTKADVYSFGMVILETISGERNTSHPTGLISLVLQYLNEGRLLELKDARLKEPCSEGEIRRCIHIALLCLLEEPQMRPNMREINVMLTSKSSPIPSLPHLSSFWGNVGPPTVVDSSSLLYHSL